MTWQCQNCKSFNSIKNATCQNCYQQEIHMSDIIDMIDDLKVDDLKDDDLKDDKVYDLTVNNFNVDELEKFNDILTQDSNKLITFASQKIDELRGILQGIEPSFFNEKIEHIQNVLIQKIELLKSHTNIMFDNDVSDVLQIFKQELISLSQDFRQVLEKDYELLKSYILEHKRIIEADYLQIEQRCYKSHILVLGANYSNNDVNFWSRIDINYIGLGIDTSNANVKTRFQNNWNSPNYWGTSLPSKVFAVIYIDRFSLYKICKDGQLDNFLQFINHYRNKETKLLITKNEMAKIENDKIENNPIFNHALKYFLENKWVYTMDVNFTQLFTNTTWITSLEHKDIENREKWIVFEFIQQ